MSISKIYDNLHFISYFSRIKKKYISNKKLQRQHLYVPAIERSRICTESVCFSIIAFLLLLHIDISNHRFRFPYAVDIDASCELFEFSTNFSSYIS